MRSSCFATTLTTIAIVATACVEPTAPSPLLRVGSNPAPQDPAPTPPPVPTFTITGRVTETGTGSPISMVTVQGGGAASTTDSEGSYEISALGYGPMAFSFKGSGFEDRDYYHLFSRDERVDIQLQRTLIVPAGGRLRATLYQDDPAYPTDIFGESNCEPCKRIRVKVEGSGTLVIRLVFFSQATKFGLAITTPDAFLPSYYVCCGSELTKEMAVRPGEVRLYVYPSESSLAQSQPFEVLTELRAN